MIGPKKGQDQGWLSPVEASEASILLVFFCFTAAGHHETLGVRA
jgi:hypothetical protein